MHGKNDRRMMRAYSGHYYDKNKNLESSSGGAATALAEEIINKGGIVYGAVYEEDYYSARFDYAERIDELGKFKGSKYSFVDKMVIRKGKRISLYKDVADMLKQGRSVLVIGLGCDIGSIYKYLLLENVNRTNLYTVELICNGVTSKVVLKEYIMAMEELYKSKIVHFNLRHKENKWNPTYIHMKFQNGMEIKNRFDFSEYAYAFYHYKEKMCYKCLYKGVDNHVADLAIGDFWGCNEGMNSYDETGVSVIICQSNKGNKLVENLDAESFCVKKIEDISYILYKQPSYLHRHQIDNEWKEFDSNLKSIGLMQTVHRIWEKSMPLRIQGKKFSKLIVWGAGKCLKENYFEIETICKINCICDSNTKKAKEQFQDKEIIFPDRLKQETDAFVLITIDNPTIREKIANDLIDMNFLYFDFYDNWIKYAKIIWKGNTNDR